MYYIIYETTNLINKKIYVGAHQTEKLEDGYLGSGLLIKKAIKKHGKENFKRKILFFLNTDKEMFEKEAEIVNEEFIERENTYNLNNGGSGPLNYTRENISKSNKGRTSPMKGKHHSKETKEKLRKINLGNRHSKETKEKISKSKLGKHHSKETKEKISLNSSHHPSWNKNKKLKPLSEEHKRKISESMKLAMKKKFNK